MKIKKILKRLGLTLGILLILLITAPFLFKSKIKAAILDTIHEQISAKVNFDSFNLSFIRNFPDATVTIKGLSVINKAPFEGDTLFYTKKMMLTMNMKSVVGGADKPKKIKKFKITDTQLQLTKNKLGENFDILIEKETENTKAKEVESKEGGSVSVDFNNYAIENLSVLFNDATTATKLEVNNFSHSGSGNFKEEVIDLKTITNTFITLEKDSVVLLNNTKFSLDAVLAIDLKNSTYTFKENKLLINQLPLQFDGFIQMKSNTFVDLTFNTPTSSFSNLLKLIPSTYTKSFDQIKTTGNFSVNGKVNGEVTETKIPAFLVTVNANDASLKYPDLPKTIKNINIRALARNKTGIIDDTEIQLDKLSFNIDKDVFNANATIKSLTKEVSIKAALDGVINLETLHQAYPIPIDNKLSGVIKTNLKTSFTMDAVNNEDYQQIENSGEVSLTNFNYQGEEVAKPIQITEALINFNTEKISLDSFKAKTGGSDLKIAGILDNFYGFLFKKGVLKGNFDLQSNQFNVDDFMVSDTSSPSTQKTEGDEKTTAKDPSTQKVKIPSFLDCTFNANATNVKYSNLELKNVKGTLMVKDEAVMLKNLKMNTMGGNLQASGNISTKGAKNNFSMKMNLDALDITESFTKLEFLKRIAPLANVIDGKLHTNIDLKGNLTDELTPDINSLSGKLSGKLMNAKVNPKKSPLLNQLNSSLKFLDLDKLNLNDADLDVDFEDGKVVIAPFQIKHKDIDVDVSGKHGLNKEMDYDLTFNVPASYFGKEASGVLSRLSATEISKISVPVKANLTGSFKKPSIKTDLKGAGKKLADKIIQSQKGKLKDKGADLINQLIGGGKKKDSTSIKNKGEELLKKSINSLFKKKKNN